VSSTVSAKPSCFVISPIGDEGSDIRLHADMVLNAIIRAALPHYDIKRADHHGSPDVITDFVITEIIEAALVVADLSFNNANVFYELGIRHMVEKPVIPIVAYGTRLPFDNAPVNTIDFKLNDWRSIEAARERIEKAAKEATAVGYRVSTPVTGARGRKKLAESTDSRDVLIAGLSARIDALEAKVVRPSGLDPDKIENIQRIVRHLNSNDLLDGFKPNALSRYGLGLVKLPLKENKNDDSSS